MTQSRYLAKDFAKMEKSAFNPMLGVRVAIIIVAPIALAVLLQQSYLFFIAIGAFLFALTETDAGFSAPFRRLLVYACFFEAAAFGLGTLVATTGPIFSPILLGIALFVIFLARGSPKWSSLGIFTAISFAFGVGMPGATVEAAGFRAGFALLGGLWGLLGFELHRLIEKHRTSQITPPSLAQSMSKKDTIISAILLGIACAIGFFIGFALGFPRDYWVVATIILTVRPRISLTTTFTIMLSVGTIIGALISAAITITFGNDPYVLTAFLFVIGVLLFSSRGVNFGLTQIFMTSFIIILLNIAYPGEWYLAINRIVNVGIGVLISLVVVELLAALKKTSAS